MDTALHDENRSARGLVGHRHGLCFDPAMEQHNADDTTIPAPDLPSGNNPAISPVDLVGHDPWVRVNRLLVRWFVQYNPLFSLSALCVFAGVLMVSRTLGTEADVALTLVLEGYQVLLIALAGLLYRRLCEHRPGVILGLIALVFLIDPTLQLSALAVSGHLGLTVLWALAFAAKWRALAWAFQLRLSHSAMLLPPMGAVFITLLPNLRVLGVSDRTLPLVLGIGAFLLVFAARTFVPKITSTRALGEVGEVMFPRLLRATAGLIAAGIVYQSWNAALAVGPKMLLAPLGGAVLALGATSTSERVVWKSLLGVGMIAVAASPVGAVLLGTVTLCLAGRRHAPRVFVAAILFGVLFLDRLIAPGGDVGWLWGMNIKSFSPVEVSGQLIIAACASALLLVMLRRRRAPSTVPALLLLWAHPLRLWAPESVPPDGSRLGMLLLAAGFVLLPAGVWAQRRVAQALARHAETTPSPPPPAGPASAAAIPR